MPRIARGHFDIFINGETISFVSSEDSAKIIRHTFSELYNALYSHDTLKEIPAEKMRDFLGWGEFNVLAAGESIADSKETVIQAIHEAVDSIDKEANRLTPKLRLPPFYEGRIIHRNDDTNINDIHVEHNTYMAVFATGRSITRASLQEMADLLPENAGCKTWGHVFDDSLVDRVKVSVFAWFGY